MYFHRRRLLVPVIQHTEPDAYIYDIDISIDAYVSYIPEQLRRLNGSMDLYIPDYGVHVTLKDFDMNYPNNDNPDWSHIDTLYTLRTNELIPNDATCDIVITLANMGDGITFYDGTTIWSDYNKRKEIRTFTHPLGSNYNSDYVDSISYTCTLGELVSNGIHVIGGARYSLNHIGIKFGAEIINEEDYTGGSIHTTTNVYMTPTHTYPYESDKNLPLTIKYAYYDYYGNVKQGQHRMVVNTNQLVAGSRIEIPELSSYYLGYELVGQQNFWSCTYDKQVPQYTSSKVNGQTIYTPVTVTDVNNVDEDIFVYFAGFDGELGDSNTGGGYGYY